MVGGEGLRELRYDVVQRGQCSHQGGAVRGLGPATCGRSIGDFSPEVQPQCEQARDGLVDVLVAIAKSVTILGQHKAKELSKKSTNSTITSSVHSVWWYRQRHWASWRGTHAAFLTLSEANKFINLS